MTITLSPQTEAMLREEAERTGQEKDALADSLLARALSERSSDFAEAVQGIQRGLDAAKAGRVKPLAQVVAEARAKHGLPADWPQAYSGPMRRRIETEPQSPRYEVVFTDVA